MSRPQIPAANLDSTGELSLDTTPSPMNLLASFNIPALANASEYTKIVGEAEHNFLTTQGQQVDSLNKLLFPAGSESSDIPKIPNPTLPQSMIDHYKKLYPDISIDQDTPMWAANLLVKEYQSKRRNEELAQNANPGDVMSLLSDGASFVGGSINPVSLALSSVGGALFGRAVGGISGQLMKFHKVQEMFGVNSTMTGNRLLTAASRNAVKGYGYAAGFQAGDESLRYLSDPNDSKKEGNNFLDALYRTNIAGLEGAGIGGVLGAIFDRTPNLNNKEKESISQNLEPVTQTSHLAAQQQAAADLFNGLDPSVSHILKKGRYDSGVKLRDALQKAGVDTGALAEKLSDGDANLKEEYMKAYQQEPVSAVEDAGKAFGEKLKNNPDIEFNKDEFSNEIKNSLEGSQLDHQTYHDSIPDKVDKNARVDQESLLKDYDNGNILKQDLPLDVRKRVTVEERIKIAQARVDGYEQKFHETGKKLDKEMRDFNKFAVKDLKSQRKPLLKPDQETRNIKKVLFDDDNNPVEKWQNKKAEVKRLKQLAKQNNEARNLQARLLFSTKDGLKSLFKDSKDQAIFNKFYHVTVMKTLRDHVENKNEPVSKGDIEDFHAHQQSSGIENPIRELPGSPEAKEIQDSINEFDRSGIESDAKKLDMEDVNKQLEEADRAVDNIPKLKSMIDRLTNCARRGI